MQRLFIDGEPDDDMTELRDECIARIAEGRTNIAEVLRIIWESGFDSGVLAERPIGTEWIPEKTNHSTDDIEERFGLPPGLLRNIKDAITNVSSEDDE